jgi:hypothetical protein
MFSCKTNQNKEDFSAETSRFSDEFLGQLYAESMQGCYEYMFDYRTSFEHNGSNYGTFCAGLKGMVLYSGFDRAVLDFLAVEQEIDKTKFKGFYDLQKFELLAEGLSVFRSGQKKFNPWGIQKDGIQDFHHYNPVFIQWALQNLIPDPQCLIGDVRAIELYRGVFSRYFRMMAESHQYILRKGFDKETKAYQDLFAGKSFDGLRYLDERYGGVFKSYQKIEGVSTMTAPMAIGFWLRRKIDGTDQIFWKGLTSFLKKYDGEWYGETLTDKK